MRVSIVTPNRNRRDFLSFTMKSVLAADNGALEYVVVDGASNDGSADVVKAHAGRLHAYFIEPDAGPYHAVAKGFAHTTGDVMGWINSGDMLFPDSLAIICDVFGSFPQIEWITSRVLSFLSEDGRLVHQGLHQGIARKSFLSGEHLLGFSRARSLTLIQQESTFWRRSLWERAGGRLDTSLRLAADFELWARFFQHAELWSVSPPLGAFRHHRDQLSKVHWQDYFTEASGVLKSLQAEPRWPLAQNLSVGLRRLLPRPARPIAHRLGLFAAAPCCDFDPKTNSWHLSYF